MREKPSCRPKPRRAKAEGLSLMKEFHPEATPGPEDANYLFDEFVKMLT